MNHGSHRRLVDAQSKGNRAHQHAHFVRHPAFLVATPLIALHLGVVRYGGNALVLQKVDRFLDSIDGRRVDDDVAVIVIAQAL